MCSAEITYEYLRDASDERVDVHTLTTYGDDELFGVGTPIGYIFVKTSRITIRPLHFELKTLKSRMSYEDKTKTQRNITGGYITRKEEVGVDGVPARIKIKAW